MSIPSPSDSASPITLLATLVPPKPTCAWQTVPHPSRPLLATCYSDKTVRIHSLIALPSHATDSPDPSSPSPPSSTPVLKATLQSTISGGHKRSIRSVAWKPNTPKGELILATGSFDASIGIWRRLDNSDLLPTKVGADLERSDSAAESEGDDEWTFAIVLDGHESEVKSVAFSAGGNFLATCSRDKSLWIWEEVAEDEYETIAVLQEHEGDVKAVSWHPEEELVGSVSYDDEARLWKDEGDDWGCVWRSLGAKTDAEKSQVTTDTGDKDGKLGTGENEEAGHKSTVWDLAWEGLQPLVHGSGDESSVEQQRWHERRKKSGPRLMTCSDDMSIRVWRRVPKQGQQRQNQFSIIKSRDTGEEWVQEATLPKAHLRSIYAIGWSHQTGRVVSCSGDGRIVVYQEEWVDSVEEAPKDHLSNGGTDEIVNGTSESPLNQASDEAVKSPAEQTTVSAKLAKTQWRIIAQKDAVHGVYEINHVIWVTRPQPSQQDYQERDGRPDEEIIASTGDDGEVKLWSLNLEG